jgi:hypothetical protein
VARAKGRRNEIAAFLTNYYATTIFSGSGLYPPNIVANNLWPRD